MSYLVDYGLASSQNWRLMFGLAAIPAILMFLGMYFQHESPHWLVAQGREDEARAVLERVRDASDIDAEIIEVRALSQRRSSARDLLNPKVRHALTIGIALAVFQQITGINTIIYYAPTLLSSAGFGSSAALLANVVNGVVNVGMTGGGDLAARPHRAPALTADRHRRHGGGHGDARAHLPHRRKPADRRRRLRRDRRVADLHRLLRGRSGPGVLAADQ